MAATTPPEPSIERHQIRGHAVEIRKLADREELWIDGERRKFFAVEGGYLLFDDVFRKPYPTLPDAVKAFFEHYAVPKEATPTPRK